MLSHLVPGFDSRSNFEFQLMKTSEGNYFLISDLNFKALNEEYHKLVPPTHSSVTESYILAHIQDARADTFFAAYYLAEPVTSPLSSDLMKLKHFEFLRRRDLNSDDISLFHEIVVPEFPTIKEAINSGQRSMKEFVHLLDEASKFKKWLIGSSPDVGLVQSYHKEVTKKSWVGQSHPIYRRRISWFRGGLSDGNPGWGSRCERGKYLPCGPPPQGVATKPICPGPLRAVCRRPLRPGAGPRDASKSTNGDWGARSQS